MFCCDRSSRDINYAHRTSGSAEKMSRNERDADERLSADEEKALKKLEKMALFIGEAFIGCHRGM